MNKNKLKINKNGLLNPKFPAHSFNRTTNYINYSAPLLSSAPLFYVGNRVNTIYSPPNSFAILKYGNGSLYPLKYPTDYLIIDNKNYKIIK